MRTLRNREEERGGIIWVRSPFTKAQSRGFDGQLDHDRDLVQKGNSKSLGLLIQIKFNFEVL